MERLTVQTQENEVHQWIARRRRRWGLGGGIAILLAGCIVFSFRGRMDDSLQLPMDPPGRPIDTDHSKETARPLQLAPVAIEDTDCDSVCAALALLDEAREEGWRCPRESYGEDAVRLQWDDSLADLAGAQAEFLAEMGYLAHETPDNFLGKTVRQRSDNWGIDGVSGEVLYRGSGRGEVAMKWWLDSSIHCRLLLHPEMKHIGLDWVDGRQGVVWVGIVSE